MTKQNVLTTAQILMNSIHFDSSVNITLLSTCIETIYST